MSENGIDSENISKRAPDTAKPKAGRKPAKSRAKKTAAKAKTERANKKAEVVEMM